MTPASLDINNKKRSVKVYTPRTEIIKRMRSGAVAVFTSDVYNNTSFPSDNLDFLGFRRVGPSDVHGVRRVAAVWPPARPDTPKQQCGALSALPWTRPACSALPPGSNEVAQQGGGRLAKAAQ